MTATNELTVTIAEIDELEQKLAALDSLGDREREVLSGVFALAGQAAAEAGDEVTGFMPTAVERIGLPAVQRSILPGSLAGHGLLLPAVHSADPPGELGSFSWGMHGSGGGGGAG